MKALTVLIITRDEELNLPHVLESVRGAKQIFIVDSGSTDRTVMIAREFGATVVHQPWLGYARQKNWALKHLPVESDWLLLLDADEVVTPELAQELNRVTSLPSAMVGYYINRHFVWQGSVIRHSGYYPSWNLRLFRPGMARYEERDVHEHMIVDGPVGYLHGELRHEDRRGRAHLWQKHLVYAELEAREMVRALQCQGEGRLRAQLWGSAVERRRFFKDRVWPYLPLRWLLRFIYMYVLSRGFLDGRAGWDLSLFISRYEREINRKFSQLQRRVSNGSGDCLPMGVSRAD